MPVLWMVGRSGVALAGSCLYTRQAGYIGIGMYALVSTPIAPGAGALKSSLLTWTHMAEQSMNS